MSNPPALLNKNLAVLARVLERLERSGVPVDAQQYRSLVNHLAAELMVAPQDAGLDAMLRACPAVAELYENLNYHLTGLSHSPADASINALLGARELIDSARRGAML